MEEGERRKVRWNKQVGENLVIKGVFMGKKTEPSVRALRGCL